VLFEDRATRHKAARAWALEYLKIETRLLPKAIPELNPEEDEMWEALRNLSLEPCGWTARPVTSDQRLEASLASKWGNLPGGA